ncbi:c-type cytochrome [Variovorax dokdonensis]|uniref:C-type cytochrome n=1 Tax=Variovorax dokdonensis TaxID=344883 RepID=A0ABT7N545_9BURK|nr:c-type cytochrome [Variovorax dokdonensis]MDM0043069.1 c-type cytochrome [Variovorax dokdonensis]
MKAGIAFLASLATLAISLAAHAAPQAGDVTAGKAAFAACASCHQVGTGARHAFGPRLDGVIGRRAGTQAGFNYSPAMRKSEIVWSPSTLAAYIRHPDEVVPGTSMRFSGWAYSEQKLADLFAYLQTFP